MFIAFEYFAPRVVIIDDKNCPKVHFLGTPTQTSVAFVVGRAEASVALMSACAQSVRPDCRTRSSN